MLQPLSALCRVLLQVLEHSQRQQQLPAHSSQLQLQVHLPRQRACSARLAQQAAQHSRARQDLKRQLVPVGQRRMYIQSPQTLHWMMTQAPSVHYSLTP